MELSANYQNISDLKRRLSALSEHLDVNEDSSENIEVNEGGSFSENEEELRQCVELPAVNSTVKFKTEENDLWHTAKILSKGGKSVGRNKYYLNIKVDGEEEPKGVFWDKHVDVWKMTEQTEYIVLFSKSDELKEQVVVAKQLELDNWKTNNVYQRVKNRGQRVVSSRWVYAKKDIPGTNDIRIKARLVCRGYEEDSSLLRTDSPTCTKESMRLVSCTAMSYGWECKSLDVRSAFLQGFPIEREIYMKPPPDADEPDILWKLCRCPYGLNDAPRSWFNRVKYELNKLNVRSSLYDEALFFYKVEDNLAGILALQVDDFIYSGNNRFKKEVIDKLLKVFEIRVQNCGNFKYLGLNLVQSSTCIQLDQHMYVQSLEGVRVSPSRSENKEALLTVDERKQLRQMCGKLLWVANNTRPDISYETSTLCNAGKEATVNDLLKVNKLVKKVKLDKGVVKFPNLGNPMEWSLAVFSDSSYANLSDGSSQGGYVVFVAAPEGKVAPLSWQSKKLQRVTKSTLI